MADQALVNTLVDIVRNGSPLILAAIGETFTERAGVVNLSLDGSLMLSALAGFAVGIGTQISTQSLVLGMVLGTLAAMAVGIVIALIVAAASIELRQSQVAVGFILTLLCGDLARFLGASYTGRPGLDVLYVNIPILSDVPVVGRVLFRQDVFTYLSYLAIILAWFWIFRTKPGLALRSVGERPETAFVRGVRVNLTRYLYTAVGGALVGMGGAAYTLSVKSKWLENDITGNGWIALAIVIFGGWYPARVAFGVYLVAGLRVVATSLQGSGIPIALTNAIPWLLMIGTLLVVSGPYLDRLLKVLPPQLHPLARALLRAKPPAALGTTFEQEGRG